MPVLPYLPTNRGPSLARTKPVAISDFAANGTFTRASAATFWDGNRLYRVPTGVCRVQYLVVNGKLVKFYLHEPQRTNYIEDCHDLTNTSFWSTNVNITAVAGVARPDGFGDVATTLEWTLGTNQTKSYKASVLDAHLADNTDYCLTFWAWSISGVQELRVTTQDRAGTNVGYNLTLTTAPQRFEIPFNTASGGSAASFYFGNNTSSGLGNRKIGFAGFQFEEGKYATSLIETAGATATRAEDVLSVTMTQDTLNRRWVSYFVPLAALDERPSGSVTALLYQSSSGVVTQIRLAAGASAVTTELFSGGVVGEPTITGFDYAAGDILTFTADAPAGYFRIEGSSVDGTVEATGTPFAFPSSAIYKPLITTGANAQAGWVSDLYKL